jgi:hypothetical protein
MRQEFADRGEMSGRDHSDERRAKLLPRDSTDGRLPAGLSVLVIAAFSALAWAVLVILVLGLWAAF